MSTSSDKTPTLQPEVLDIFEHTKDLKRYAIEYMIRPGQSLPVDMTKIISTILLMSEIVTQIEMT